VSEQQEEEEEKERASERVRVIGRRKERRRREIPLSSYRQFDLGRSAQRRWRGAHENERSDGSATVRFFSGVPAAVGVGCAGRRVRTPRKRTVET